MVSLRTTLGLDQREVAGLDIGTASVKMVQLQRQGDGYIATHAARVEVAPGGDSAEEAQAATVKAIRQCLAEQPGLSRMAVCALCGPEIMVRGFRFPQLPPEAVGQAVMMEAQQVCPLDIKSSVVDYQLVEGGGSATGAGAKQAGPIRGIFVVATNDAVRSKSHLVRGASVRNVLLDVEGLALLNCVRLCQAVPAGSSIAVVNVGRTFTNVALLGADGLPFIRDLPHASDEIIAQIARAHGISPAAATQILRKNEESAEPALDLRPTLRNACRKLITDIAETLRYYTLQEGAAPIARVNVCGGFALVGDFVKMMAESLPEEVTVLNPFTNIPWAGNDSGRELVRKSGAALAVAAGLAMRTI